jgi:hypothetical protein
MLRLRLSGLVRTLNRTHQVVLMASVERHTHTPRLHPTDEAQYELLLSVVTASFLLCRGSFSLSDLSVICRMSVWHCVSILFPDNLFTQCFERLWSLWPESLLTLGFPNSNFLIFIGILLRWNVPSPHFGVNKLWSLFTFILRLSQM